MVCSWPSSSFSSKFSLMYHLLQGLHISVLPNVDISNSGPLLTCIPVYTTYWKLNSVSPKQFIVLPKPASSWVSCSREGHGHLNLGSKKKLGIKEVAMGMGKETKDVRWEEGGRIQDHMAWCPAGRQIENWSEVVRGDWLLLSIPWLLL